MSFSIKSGLLIFNAKMKSIFLFFSKNFLKQNYVKTNRA